MYQALYRKYRPNNFDEMIGQDVIVRTLKNAIKNSAAFIIVVHNHPTGDSMPSHADIEITNKLFEIGKLVGIPVIDHIIIGYNNFYSFYSKERIDINE